MDNTFTAVNTYPTKLITHYGAIEGLLEGEVRPIHVTLMPTYNCNLNCPFCSCAKADRNVSLPFKTILNALPVMKELGTKAITISGGGEPCCYPELPQLISAIHSFDMEVGLITNGTLLDKLPTLILRRLTWCRVSVADTRSFTEQFNTLLSSVVSFAACVDWGFSYVVTDKPNLPNLLSYVKFAVANRFKHVRVVDDLLHLAQAFDMKRLQAVVEGEIPEANDTMVYLSRKKYVPGCVDCRISLLRPIIGADGEIYPCCGTSSAHEYMDLALPKNMSIGHVSRMKEIWKDQAYFNGENCSRCYYDEYNQVLNSYFTEITHHNFV